MSVEEIWSGINHKLIAILRGVEPHEVEAIVIELLNAGFQAIEIPLNSPEPFQSIQLAAAAAKNYSKELCLIGAGTVLSVEDVRKVKQAGGNLIVSPNVDAAVIQETRSLEMFSAPGVFSPSEALLALQHGAHALKFFPTFILGADGIKAISAVLPNGSEICAVGGVGNEDFKTYLDVGVQAFGLGSSLYKPGMSAESVSKLASETMATYKSAIL